MTVGEQSQTQMVGQQIVPGPWCRGVAVNADAPRNRAAYSTSLELPTASQIASAGGGPTVLFDPRYDLDLLSGARL